jgi:hypothetical protein
MSGRLPQLASRLNLQVTIAYDAAYMAAALRVGTGQPGGSMSDTNFLDVFPSYLRSLGDDAERLGQIVEAGPAAEAARALLVGGLNYLFKSLDLIPDGIDDIGYLDDAFVLRVACELAMREDVSDLGADSLKTLNTLSEDADTVRGFLGDDYPRLEAYVMGLRKGAARGRTVQDILHDEETRSAFVSDVRGFSKGYEPPGFTREEKNLIKLRAFFDAKLPK